MSISSPRDDRDPEELVRQQLREDFAPHTKSKQAVYHAKNGRQPFGEIDRHHDGEAMFREFGMAPFWKQLEKAQRHENQAYRYPGAWLNHLIHVDDAELDALERGDLAIFDDAPRTRRKVMEWLARPENDHVLEVMEDGGMGWFCHAKPGRGKTSFNLVPGVVRNMEINNETVLWQLTLDECEPLPVAPFMTLAMPEDVDVAIEAVPTRYDLPAVEIDATDVFRDVITYDDPVDLLEQVVPGALYGVLPDPRFRKCERLVRAAYIDAWEADTAAEVTPLRDFAHALLEVRARRDVFLHRTTLFVDEFGDLCPRNPESDEADTYRKTKEWPKREGKGRKKNLSISQAAHSCQEVDEEIHYKKRCFVTFPRTPVPTCQGPPTPPLPADKPKHISKGSAFAWDETDYVELNWPNPYRRYDFRGEIKIRYPEMEAELDAME